MIPMTNILAWKETAPWPEVDLVEQDLILSRALVELFNGKDIGSKVAFRGGTALNKLHFSEPARFSEDIDLVQINAELIGDTLDAIRQQLDGWLGQPQRVLKEGRAVLSYRYNTEDSGAKVKLKVEINTREHKAKLGFEEVPFSVENEWFSASTSITTYRLEELIGTKIRALYQRKKGRDLFDLWFTGKHCKIDWQQALTCFKFYIEQQGLRISAAEFQQNIESKLADKVFVSDIVSLKRPGLDYPKDEVLKTAHMLFDFLNQERK